MKKLLLILLSFLLISPLCLSGNRWTSKPPVGSTINWGHSLSREIIGCWLMNEKNGKIIRNIVSRQIATLDTATFSTIAGITGIVCDATAERINMTLGDFMTPDKFTIIFKYVSNGLTGNYAQFFAASNGGSNFQLYRKSATSIEYRIGTVLTFTIKNIYDSKPHQVAVIFNGSTINIGVDSIIYTPLSFTNQPGLTSFTTRFGSGGAGETNLHINGLFEYIYIFNRVLSPSEIQQLYQDPYCFIQPPTIWSKFSTAVAAARRFFIVQ